MLCKVNNKNNQETVLLSINSPNNKYITLKPLASNINTQIIYWQNKWSVDSISLLSDFQDWMNAYLMQSGSSGAEMLLLPVKLTGTTASWMGKSPPMMMSPGAEAPGAIEDSVTFISTDDKKKKLIKSMFSLSLPERLTGVRLHIITYIAQSFRKVKRTTHMHHLLKPLPHPRINIKEVLSLHNRWNITSAKKHPEQKNNQHAPVVFYLICTFGNVSLG